MILVLHYDTFDKANALVSMGEISSLQKKMTPTDSNHTFDTPEKDVTVFYGRERGEDGCELELSDTYAAYLGWVDSEFNYIFIDGEWKFSTNDSKKFKPVKDHLVVEILSK